MKRKGKLFDQLTSMSNLELADIRARKGKRNTYGVRKFDLDKKENLIHLQYLLKSGEYRTSKYKIGTITEYNKIRTIHKLPYFPDRVCHHAVANIILPILTKSFVYCTYSSIKKKGIHLAKKKVERDIRRGGVKYKYCLKLDIKKYYELIDNEILKSQLGNRFKDPRLLNLLYEIIDSSIGCPLGNYLSQLFANFYLTKFDYWLYTIKGVKYSARYMDDILLLSNSKIVLHNTLLEIKKYLKDNLKLEVKDNWQIFPINSRGIDFVGYRIYRTHTLLRKRIKKRFIKACRNNNIKSIPSYKGWLDYCKGKNLYKKYIKLTTYDNNK